MCKAVPGTLPFTPFSWLPSPNSLESIPINQDEDLG